MEQNDLPLCCNAVSNYLNSCAPSLLKVKKDCTWTCAEELVFALREDLPKGSFAVKLNKYDKSWYTFISGFCS